MKIKTQHIAPPIPNRNFDWCAYDDDTYDGDGSRIGYGATEREAIDNLLEQCGVEPVLYWFNVETERLVKGSGQ